MKDYNIEYASQTIHSEKTKEYFKEVSSSYFNGNYRAAIVTLYSVVINDIIVKLETLDELYSDATAKTILEETKALQQANPNSPDWEKDIIEKIKTRTSLIDNVDYAHILALRNDRHLCAHPVIDKDDKLYTPNKESVAAHIRNMLESLFLKPPILSKKILSAILVDIESKSDLLIDEVSFEQYVKAKYLNNLNPTIELSIFRNLWKFVFRLNDEPSEANRLINYRLLDLLYRRNIVECNQKIKSDKEYFSNVLDSSDTLNFVIRFIADYEFLYADFRQDLHLLISKQVSKDINAKTVAWFLNDSFSRHIEMLKQLVSTNFDGIVPYDASNLAYQRLINIGFAKGYGEDVIKFIIWRYAMSKNYNDGDKVYAFIVQPYLNYFTKEHFELMCKEINKNSQVYDRWQSTDDHRELKNIIIAKVGGDFEFDKYSNIFH